MRKPRPLLPLFALLLFAGLAQGQPAESPRWYKVELMIFAQEPGDTTSEQWEATPRLQYPDRYRFLIDPAEVEANRTAYPDRELTVDERGRQIIAPPADEGQVDVAPPSDGEQAALAPPDDAAAAEAATGDTTVSPAQSPEDTAERPLTPTPFVLLPAGERTFPSAYMRRSGRYNPLFHQAWYQPILEEHLALPIVLDHSGDTGEWPRLQGSVKLYQSRYLHVETNLWLNTPGDYLPGEWRMPAPPLGPPSLIVEEAEEPATADIDSLPVTGMPGFPPASESIPPPGAPDPQEVEEEPGPEYPFRHAVLLQQKRRMRSTEVHYLDHPLFGVVVTLTPLTAEELEALASENQVGFEGTLTPRDDELQ